MLNRFIPNKQVNSIFDIKASDLKAKGFKGVITDLDNTLVAWDVKHATPEVIAWFEEMTAEDIKVTIISNNNRGRVKAFSDPLGMPFAYSAKKPLKTAFVRVAREMGLKKEEIVVIGDQLLTDILGGNSAGFYTILVVPIVKSDAKITTFNRNLERFILNQLRKKGKMD